MKRAIRPLVLTMITVVTITLTVNSQPAGAATWTPPAYRSEKVLDLTLMGDSYTAGNGAGDYKDGHRDAKKGKSYQSSKSWGRIYEKYLKSNNIKVNLTNLSNSGDTTQDVLNEQIDQVSKYTDLVMMTIGGNDVNFGGIVMRCFAFKLLEPSLCENNIKLAKNKLANTIKETEKIFLELDEKLDDDAVIILVSYPLLSMDGVDYKMGYCRTKSYLFPTLCGDWLEYDAGESVRSLGKVATDAQRVMVDRWNKDHKLQVKYIDSVANVFHGHEPNPSMLDRNDYRWINEFIETKGMLFNDGKTHSEFSVDKNEFYHPNIIGHQKIAKAISDQLNAEQSFIMIGLITNEILGAIPPNAKTRSAPIASFAAPTSGDDIDFSSWPKPLIKTKPASSDTPLQSAYIQGPYVGKIGEPIEIDASASYSVTGDITSYKWEFDDPELNFTTTKALFEHTFNKEYSGEMRLTITDSEGHFTTASSELIVSDDGDSTPRSEDNCPDIYNYSQSDYDNDGIGDECDPSPGYPTEGQEGVFEIIDGIPSIPLLYPDGTILYPDGSKGHIDDYDSGDNNTGTKTPAGITTTPPITKNRWVAASQTPTFAITDQTFGGVATSGTFAPNDDKDSNLSGPELAAKVPGAVENTNDESTDNGLSRAIAVIVGLVLGGIILIKVILSRLSSKNNI